MNKFIKNLIGNYDFASLPKIKKTNVINLIKYDISIYYDPFLNSENEDNSSYNKLFLSYIKYKSPDYYYTLIDFLKQGIYLFNVYTKISGWYFDNNSYNKDIFDKDLIMIFYVNKSNQTIIDKKIKDLYHKFKIKDIIIEKKDTHINTYNILNDGDLFISQDPFDLNKLIYIYLYGICDETNTLVSKVSYTPCLKDNTKLVSFIGYKYFTNEKIIVNDIDIKLISDNINSDEKYGYNNFIFVERNTNNILNINLDKFIDPIELCFLNFINLIDLPNNKKLFFKKITYKDNTILLYEEGKCININTIYKFINYSKLSNFFIIKENIYYKDEMRIKITQSNIYNEPFKIEGGYKASFL